MSKSRTPEHFPRMKVRGGRRRRDAEITRYWRTIETVDFSALGRALADLGRAAGRAADMIAEAGWQLAIAAIRSATVTVWLARRRAETHWVARHQLPATVSPWAAPTER